MGKRRMASMSKGHGKSPKAHKPVVVVKKKRPKAKETPESLQTLAEGSFGDTPI